MAGKQYTKAELLKRIADLMRMAERGKDDEIGREEAARAASKVQELLLKYNLDMADVPLEDTTAPREEYEHELFGLGKRHGTDWRRLLIKSVARHNFVRIVYVSESDRKVGPMVHLIGLPTNVQIVRELYVWLTESLDFTATTQSAVRKEAWTPAATWKDSFLRGAREIIDERLELQRREAEARNVKVTALAKRTDIELRDAVKQFLPNTHAFRISGQNRFSPEGWAKGKEAGRNVSLGRPTRVGPNTDRPALSGGR